MHIAPLQPHHHGEWLHLWQGYQDYYHVELDKAVTEQTWQRLMQADSPFTGLGAFAQVQTQAGQEPALQQIVPQRPQQTPQLGQMLGMVQVLYHPHTWTLQDCCYLIDLFVLPTARRQGVARSLIQAVYDLAQEQGCHRVYWLTKEDNLAGRALYDTLAKQTDFVQYRHDLSPIVWS